MSRGRTTFASNARVAAGQVEEIDRRGTISAYGRPFGMTDTSQGEALVAANALISRLEDLVADHLSKGDALDEKEAFYQLVEALETAPEIGKLRLALGDDPHRFGEPTPVAAGDNTG
ncbi:hypothetical protein LJR225_003766 [Phenylobacterium sp. LjRoot225]|uniref:hypothetical protein n=1 Tax=Phenylobacterium sp. LjRoot225 TaxID=3342285 RepID=UPI003ECCF655